ncbi:MAG TPA: hypothetical protein VKA08_03115 [Balneolales bacterium]|nr:hypothetical protein [Balneolales bacterium]
MSEFYLAEIQSLAGEKSKAITTLKHLLAMPPGSSVSRHLTPALLHLDPIWDPLRKEPAFQALLKKYASSE